MKARATLSRVIYQLRMYEIFERNKAAFHARFRDHAMRIMRRYGFEIVDAWETGDAGELRFVYVLRWPSVQAKERGWAAFLADEEWQRIKRETAAANGTLVSDVVDRVLVRVPYSPAG